MARYKALDDVLTLLMRNMRDGSGTEFAYYNNQFADRQQIEQYHRELTRIGDQLAHRQRKLHHELFGGSGA